LLRSSKTTDDGNDLLRLSIEAEAALKIASVLAAILRRLRRAMPSVSPSSLAQFLVQLLGESTVLAPPLTAAAVASATLGVSTVAADFVAIGVDWTLVNRDAVAYARRSIAGLVKDIDLTTRQAIRTKVADWIESGKPLSALEKALEPTFGAARASNIAATEVTRAYAEANKLAWKRAGVTTIEWRSSNDSRVCPICAPLNGRRARLHNGEFGGGIPHPPAHPRCRCWLVAVD
jgi:SPP1 gp7 family putative phage head morphogenesis protein